MGTEQIDRALSGEEIAIMQGEVVKLRLVPVPEEKPKPRRQFGTLKGKIAFDDRFFDPLPDDELRLWNGGGD